MKRSKMSLNFHLPLLLQLVFLAARTTAKDPVFKLRLSHGSVVKSWTENVWVHCGMEESAPVDDVFRIRILKRDEGGSTFKPIATLRSYDKRVELKGGSNVTAKSKIKEKSNESFLEIRWALADDETVGTFRCEANGVSTFITRFKVKSEEKAIKGVGIPNLNLLEEIKGVKSDAKRLKEGLKSWQADMTWKMSKLLREVDALVYQFHKTNIHIDEIRQTMKKHYRS